MKFPLFISTLLVATLILTSLPKPTSIFLIGDSTMADYTLDSGYMEKKYPIHGWGQVFQPFFKKDSLSKLRNLLKSDSVLILDKARGGRSTRTFFEEGRWAAVYKQLKKNDIVMIQFGHNDAAANKPERYVNVNGYKEYLRLYVNQTREKGAMPILITPVARNYPWSNGKLSNVHGEYPAAVKQVAEELKVKLIDLNQLSMDAFAVKGEKMVTEEYFMNLAKGQYIAYPDGQKDNTHFKKEGAIAVAQLVFNAMKTL
ncbi:MAG: rhamnogalacturonan acetylesterase [Pedobacter sp.]|nr:MAG: rhamnogalacturonan acetylesterase [Pedobacter sp.]